jgi:hypothetical protein
MFVNLRYIYIQMHVVELFMFQFLCMIFVANLNYIGELIYIFIQKLVGRAIYLRSEA